MDYLDPKKELKEQVTLIIGYVLVAIAITFASVILLYKAYGFNFGKNGSVVQDGLVFFSSQPNPANIYVNGKLSANTTNTRLFLPSGIYNIELSDSGYRNWYRRITVIGGSVEHFDYPLLIPQHLITQSIATYNGAPVFMSQSPSRQYILIDDPGSLTSFDLYNLNNPAKPTVSNLTLPSNILSPSVTGNQSLSVVAWSNDNQHVLLDHQYDGNNEYILLDTSNISQSVNLTTTFNLNSSDQITLNNNTYNNYYIYDSLTQVLSSATLGSSTIKPVLNSVLGYQSYGNNEILYATTVGAKSGKANVKLFTPNGNYNITSLVNSGKFLLNLTSYSGVLYVAVGTTAGSDVYIYGDPIVQLQNTPNQALAPTWVLHVNQPNYLSFSDNAQFILTENNYNYASYDIENSLGYLYSDKNMPLDPPQQHVTWMDGDRTVYVSHGKVIMQDYDNNNQQTLVSAASQYVPAFNTNYHYMYTLSPANKANQYFLQSTPLLTPADL